MHLLLNEFLQFKIVIMVNSSESNSRCNKVYLIELTMEIIHISKSRATPCGNHVTMFYTNEFCFDLGQICFVHHWNDEHLSPFTEILFY